MKYIPWTNPEFIHQQVTDLKEFQLSNLARRTSPNTDSSWTALAMSAFSLPTSRSSLFLPLAPDKGSDSHRSLLLFSVRNLNC